MCSCIFSCFTIIVIIAIIFIVIVLIIITRYLFGGYAFMISLLLLLHLHLQQMVKPKRNSFKSIVLFARSFVGSRSVSRSLSLSS